MKIIKYGDEAREQLKAGVKALADAVASTMGAAGNPVILDSVLGAPFITADGVTVAEEIELEQPVAQTGVAMLKHVARQTNKEAGDGTTTSIVLASAMMNSNLKFDGRLIPFRMMQGMEMAVNELIVELDFEKRIIDENDLETATHIATISARGDREMGELIAKAFQYSGKDGQVLLEEGRRNESKLEKIAGYQLDQGFNHPGFINNEKRQVVEFDEPVVLVLDTPLVDVRPIADILNHVHARQLSLVIVGTEISEAALSVLLTNMVQSGLKVCFVDAPEFGDKQTDFLKDIAFVTGATLISKNSHADALKNIGVLGSCKSFIATKGSSVFIDGVKTKEEVDEYISNIPENTDDKDFTKKRKARLSGRLSKITVGASSVIEMREKRDKVEDALNATKAALSDGYVIGAGMALYRASKKLEKVVDHGDSSLEYGYRIVLEAAKKPAFQILFNLFGDSEETEKYLNDIVENYEYEMGYDVRTLEKVNLFERGIIDPVKVTKSALMAAQSVVGNILSTNCVVAITGDNGDLKM